MRGQLSSQHLFFNLALVKNPCGSQVQNFFDAGFCSTTSSSSLFGRTASSRSLFCKCLRSRFNLWCDTSAFVFQFSCSEVVAVLSSSRATVRNGVTSCGHISLLNNCCCATRRMFCSFKCAYNKCICVMPADWMQVLVFILLSSAVWARHYKFSSEFYHQLLYL